MTLVQSIDRMVDWLNKNVCRQIQLKLPDDKKNGADYEVKFVNPTAFPLFVPGKDRLPPSVTAPVPCICVQLMEGTDDLIKRNRQMKIRLCLASWNPGRHGDEILYPREDPGEPGEYLYSHLLSEKGAQTYMRNMDGWRDSFNFADIVLRETEGTEFIAGMRLVKEAGIKYGLFQEDGDIWDYYPYWHCWVSFTLETGVVARTPEIYAEYL